MSLDILEQAVANVTPADLTAFARTIPDPALYTLNQYAPERQIQGIRYRVTHQTRGVDVAKFRVYDAETPVGRRAATRDVLDGILPPLGVKTMIGELETILEQMSRGADVFQLEQAMYDDTTNNVLAIRARQELARGDLLTDGKFTLNQENGLILEADFGLATSHKPTASTLWTDPDALTIEDEQAWQDQVTDDLGDTIDQVITSQRVYRLLLSNNQYRQVFYANSGATSLPNLTPSQMQTVRAQYNLPPIHVYDAKVRVDGTVQRVIPDNMWLAFAKTGLAETQYGTTAESLALSSGSNPQISRQDAPGIVVTRRVNDDPVSVWVRANAVAMPVLFRPENLIAATVA